VELAQGAVRELADRLLLRQRERRKLDRAAEVGADPGNGVIVRAVAKEEDPMFLQKGDTLLEVLWCADAEFLWWFIKDIRYQ
jgi:hypothetical protein